MLTGKALASLQVFMNHQKYPIQSILSVEFGKLSMSSVIASKFNLLFLCHIATLS